MSKINAQKPNSKKLYSTKNFFLYKSISSLKLENFAKLYAKQCSFVAHGRHSLQRTMRRRQSLGLSLYPILPRSLIKLSLFNIMIKMCAKFLETIQNNSSNRLWESCQNGEKFTIFSMQRLIFSFSNNYISRPLPWYGKMKMLFLARNIIQAFSLPFYFL